MLFTKGAEMGAENKGSVLVPIRLVSYKRLSRTH
nr:MAG TPA: hypothetical protein [Caudoviricetes sp.]